jgi:hypothetical protein
MVRWLVCGTDAEPAMIGIEGFNGVIHRRTFLSTPSPSRYGGKASQPSSAELILGYRPSLVVSIAAECTDAPHADREEGQKVGLGRKTTAMTPETPGRTGRHRPDRVVGSRARGSVNVGVGRRWCFSAPSGNDGDGEDDHGRRSWARQGWRCCERKEGGKMARPAVSADCLSRSKVL